MKGDYQHLRASNIIATLEKLNARIIERFPEAGLGRVSAELTITARQLSREAAALARPAWGWRLAAVALLVAGVAAQIGAFTFIHVDGLSLNTADLIQGLEAAVNLLILFGGAIWFLLTLEERAKRRRALDGLHTLRSMAHVIDMHQLTKDPTVLLDGARSTPHSPKRSMSRFELTRYLDYCAEMEALIGKLAALFAERTRDSVVIDSVNDLETLTTGLGRKIWQKITLIGALEERPRA